MKIIDLATYLNGGHHFGHCSRCFSQFMSVRDRLAVIAGMKVCERCALKVAPIVIAIQADGVPVTCIEGEPKVAWRAAITQIKAWDRQDARGYRPFKIEWPCAGIVRCGRFLAVSHGEVR